MDRAGHLEYIRYVSEHLSLPAPGAGWSFSHQPLYYVFFGLIQRLASVPVDNEIFLVFVVSISLILSILTLILIHRILLTFFSPRWSALLAGLFATMPSFVFASSRINNDVFVIFFAALTGYFLTREKIYTASAAALGAFWSKINGLSTLAGMIVAIYVLHTQRRLASQFRYGFWMVLMITSVLCYFSRSYDSDKHRFVFVINTVSADLQIQQMDPSFHIETLFQFAESYSWEIRTKLIKYSPLTFMYGTSLLGEYDYSYVYGKYPVQKIFSRLLIAFGLLIPVLLIFGMFLLRTRNFIDCFFGVQIAVNLALWVYYFMNYPYLSNCDFRYMYPMVPAIFYILGKATQKLSAKPVVGFWVKVILVFVVLTGGCWNIMNFVAGPELAIYNR